MIVLDTYPQGYDYSHSANSKSGQIKISPRVENSLDRMDKQQGPTC